MCAKVVLLLRCLPPKASHIPSMARLVAAQKASKEGADLAARLGSRSVRQWFAQKGRVELHHDEAGDHPRANFRHAGHDWGAGRRKLLNIMQHDASIDRFVGSNADLRAALSGVSLCLCTKYVYAHCLRIVSATYTSVATLATTDGSIRHRPCPSKDSMYAFGDVVGSRNRRPSPIVLNMCVRGHVARQLKLFRK